MGFVIAALRPFAWLLCRLLFRARFYGMENIPAEGACIIAPNHVTYLDPIWITIPVRRRIYYMAWDKPFEIPVLGWVMRRFGAFPVKLEAADAAAQRAAVDLLRQGKALVMFPEGGRTTTGRLMPFKMGAFRLAATHGIPVVPVSIDGGYEVWPLGKLLPRMGRVTITYHPPVAVYHLPEGAGKAEVRQQARLLAYKTRERVASALDPTSLPEDESSEALIGELKVES